MADKILIIDDDVDTLKLVGLMLQKQGYQIAAANNGERGLTQAEVEKPDLILLDIIMPYMDGLEVLKKIKSEERLKNIPIILLTNLSQKEEISQGLELGANDYLIKSHFTPSEVLEKIKKYLN